ncbi:hypothetical protein GY45DRAFT_1328279 [Cubamyces sp. BRFM 1775]|nr:hypothetical protein GY45DRAFT_1328279 [Cubamyces sp. BRFM 1775]
MIAIPAPAATQDPCAFKETTWRRRVRGEAAGRKHGTYCGRTRGGKGRHPQTSRKCGSRALTSYT